MRYFAITIDIETDTAAFGGKTPDDTQGLRGITEGLRKYVNFMRTYDYPFTVFVTCDVLQGLDVNLFSNLNVEIASHGYVHTYAPGYLTTLSTEELLVQARTSRQILQSFFDREVIGFRAHNLMLTPTLIDILSKHYKYDSSILLHRKYGRKAVQHAYPYHPSSRCVVETGELPIIELPVSSKDLVLFKLPFVGSYIRMLPQHFFYNLHQPLIVLDLHSQDVVKFKHWKYLYADEHLSKLRKLITHYEDRDYRISLMKDIVRRVSTHNDNVRRTWKRH